MRPQNNVNCNIIVELTENSSSISIIPSLGMSVRDTSWYVGEFETFLKMKLLENDTSYPIISTVPNSFSNLKRKNIISN